ncbi:MAG TPA: hypothetical protein VFD58_07490 [Blastocatellia bacterium]|nr:hypothetical protein [Blastocatellia bacterium]
MKRLVITAISLIVVSISTALTGCNQQTSGSTNQAHSGTTATTPGTATPSAQAAQPGASPQSTATPGNAAIKEAMSKPGVPVMAQPGGQDAKNAKPGATPAAIPNSIPERLRRPLTLEEINKLPPEVRDMILRAQGRLPASPTPTPKKK